VGSAAPEYTTFALAVAGALILILLSIIAWFARSRVKARERYEELLEKRLQAGTQTMGALKSEISDMQSRFLVEFAKVVTEAKFDSYCHGHEVVHAELNHKIDGLRELQQEWRESLTETKAYTQALNKILAQMIEVGSVRVASPLAEAKADG